MDDDEDELKDCHGDEDSKAILKAIMNDGTFDHIRQKVMEQLKQDVKLKHTVQGLVAGSKALQHTDVAQGNRKQVLDSIRKELEDKLLEEASRTSWDIMCSEDSEVARLIEDKVHEALCALYEAKWDEAKAEYAKCTQDYAAQQLQLQQQQQQQQLQQQQQQHLYNSAPQQPLQYAAATGGGAGGQYNSAAPAGGQYGVGAPSQFSQGSTGGQYGAGQPGGYASGQQPPQYAPGTSGQYQAAGGQHYGTAGQYGQQPMAGQQQQQQQQQHRSTQYGGMAGQPGGGQQQQQQQQHSVAGQQHPPGGPMYSTQPHGSHQYPQRTTAASGQP